jgi:hypothetical protein
MSWLLSCMWRRSLEEVWGTVKVVYSDAHLRLHPDQAVEASFEPVEDPP